MTMPRNRADPKQTIGDGIQSALERKFIAAYLRGKGYTLSDLRRLPPDEADLLMQGACLYASLKLTEIESVAGFCHRIKTEH